MTIIDAEGKLDLSLFPKLIMKAENQAELFWRTAPDQAFALLQHSVVSSVSTKVEAKVPDIPRKIFSDTLCGYPLQIEWDFPAGRIDLRDKSQGQFSVRNLPSPTL